MPIGGSFPARAPEVNTLLFDLDGTLVHMERSGLELRFMVRATLRFARVIAPWRYRSAFWEAANRQQVHGTERTNYEVFLDTLGRHARCSRDELDRVVRACVAEDFSTLADRFGPIDGARETVLLARELGYRVVLATNPVFPLAAVQMRMRWGNVGDVPFDLVTHSEVMTRCKPHVGYYHEVLAKLGAAGRECLMIGNDPVKDLPAKDVGCLTFLVEHEGSRAALAKARGDARLDGWGTYADLQAWLRASASARPTS